MSLLLDLFISFFLVAFVSFGGASAVIPEFYRIVVTEHGWMNAQTFTELFAIAQAAPGPNVLVVTLIGLACRAWVIEDDYDSEYRYSVRPEATLLSLDTQGCVIHVGTFSKTLSPQLRLGYMVLPSALIGVFAEAKRLSDRHAATGVQRALALLLEDGSYGRHVRRIRRHQQTRQRALIHALQAHLGEQIEVQGAASGLHLVVWLLKLPASAESALVSAAREQGVCVYPVSPLFLRDTAQKTPQRHAGLIMGYALLNEEEIAKGVQRLAVAVRRVEAAQ